ncbi:MAG: hypothetical protein RLZ98_1079 [Pseudomonadota bacterium]|jgi:hypothetical protein
MVPGTPVRADELVVMPYTCSAGEAGVVLDRSQARPYAIVGRRETRRIRICTAPGKVQCTTKIVHRFRIKCGEATASWLDVAAAAARIKGITAGVARGSMTLVTRSKVEAGRDCFRKLEAFGPGAEECWSGPKPRIETLSHTLPAGFAPAHLAEARIVRSPQAGRDIVVGSLPPATAEFDNANPLVAGMKLTADVSGDEGVAVANGASGGAAGGAWTTRVVPVAEIGADDAGGEVPVTAEPLQRMEPFAFLLPLMAGIVGLLALLLSTPKVRGFLSRQRARTWLGAADALNAALTEKAEAAASAGEDGMVQSLKSMALAALSDIQPRLAALPAGWPLRTVLLKEVKGAGEKLERLFGEVPEDDEQVRRLRGRLQAVVADLRRLKEIADSANSSLSDSANGAGAPIMPTDRESAFAVLGINPDVSEKIAKKVVDALRQSWHPDHARDDADREQREARIKQINIAWDLISRDVAEA